MPSSLLPDDTPPLSTGERILAGAAAVVAQHGLRASTVRHVLVAASISRRTFYLHFPSIEGVMCDLYIQQTDILLDAVTAAVAGTDTVIERPSDPIAIWSLARTDAQSSAPIAASP